jgi:hypothetical protein
VDLLNLSGVFLELGNPVVARTYAVRGYKLCPSVFGTNHPHTLRSREILALVEQALEELEAGSAPLRLMD